MKQASTTKKIIGIIIIAVFVPLALYFLATGRIGHFAIAAGAAFLISQLLKKIKF